MLRILLTGGAGFIGSAFVHYVIEHTSHSIMNVDNLSYSGNLESLVNIEGSKRYSFAHLDICDKEHLPSILLKYKPNLVIHMAAESHVDRSIDSPFEFIQTNVVGTLNLLEAAKYYWNKLDSHEKKSFRFIHVSTDEVYGDLPEEGLFTESTPYNPSSPYAASKASSDHLVKAWFRTFGLPVLITNCSNNFGPRQYPEKLIPLMILRALKKQPLPIYGNGQQIRDWIFVEDHVKALLAIAEFGIVGESYNIGSSNERTNLNVVNSLCSLLDEIEPTKDNNLKSYSDLITFVEDRPGHDLRYAIDSTKVRNQTNWASIQTFEAGLRATVNWYVDNLEWCDQVNSKNDKYKRRGLVV